MNIEWPKILGGCLAFILVFLLIAVVGGILVSFAWNATMPYIFGLPEITWQQGIWLSVLSWFLIKSTSYIPSSK